MLALTALAGCGSEPDSNPATLSGAGGAPVAINGSSASGSAGVPAGAGGYSFEATVQPFINMACNCHQSTPLMAPFSLKPGEAFKGLVNVPSMQLPHMLLVRPSSTQDSYLWHKIDNTHLQVGGSGQVMPSTIPLNADEKKIFERWILGGALP